MKDKIRVKNIQCYTKIGVADNERAIGQRLAIDLEVYLDLKFAGLEDELKNTISYVEISKSVQRTTQLRDYKLLENLAAHICKNVFTEFERIQAIEIWVHKPHIPNPDFNGEATINIFRERKDLL